MKYARWETIENMKKAVPLTKVEATKKIQSSGLPMIYDQKDLYIDPRNVHSLVIGTIGSAKKEVITLPTLKLACLAGESAIVHDPNNEIYESTNKEFKANDYNIIKLNFDDCTDTNYWNPLELAQKFYEQKNYDKTQEIIEDLGYYLLTDTERKNEDPFWINSAISYFTGICQYALEKEKEVNFEKIYKTDEMVRENPEKFIQGMNKNSTIYINLSGILTAPAETRGGIFCTFSDRFKKYINKNNLKNMLSKSNFDLFNISKKKTIIYINSGKSHISNSLFPLFINQVYASKNDTNRLNIIIEEFYTLNPIKDFVKILNYSKNKKIIFTIMIKGFNDLKNAYDKDIAEMIKLNFTNIIYLLSQDIDTLIEISKMCGNESLNTPLISVEELKTIDRYEAIVITTRIMPFRTKLLPITDFSNK